MHKRNERKTTSESIAPSIRHVHTMTCSWANLLKSRAQYTRSSKKKEVRQSHQLDNLLLRPPAEEQSSVHKIVEEKKVWLHTLKVLSHKG